MKRYMARTQDMKGFKVPMAPPKTSYSHLMIGCIRLIANSMVFHDPFSGCVQFRSVSLSCLLGIESGLCARDFFLGLLLIRGCSPLYHEPSRVSSCMEGMISSGSALALDAVREERCRGSFLLSSGCFADCFQLPSSSTPVSDAVSLLLSLPCSTTQDSPSCGLLLGRAFTLGAFIFFRRQMSNLNVQYEREKICRYFIVLSHHAFKVQVVVTMTLVVGSVTKTPIMSHGGFGRSKRDRIGAVDVCA